MSTSKPTLAERLRETLDEVDFHRGFGVDRSKFAPLVAAVAALEHELEHLRAQQRGRPTVPWLYFLRRKR